MKRVFSALVRELNPKYDFSLVTKSTSICLIVSDIWARSLYNGKHNCLSVNKLINKIVSRVQNAIAIMHFSVVCKCALKLQSHMIECLYLP